MPEARIEDGTPRGAGWFVVNADEAPWEEDGLRSRAGFGGEGEAHFDEVGVALYRLAENGAMSIYHHEAGQEDFLVLAGTPTLLVEEEERALRRWDLVHCPPRTAHTIVNRAPADAIVFALGARREKGSARYPESGLARRHGVERRGESGTAVDAYTGIAEARRIPVPPGPWDGGRSTDG